MANARKDTGKSIYPSSALITEKLAAVRSVLLIQQQAIERGGVDSLEASIVTAHELIDALYAYKRVYQAAIRDHSANSDFDVSPFEVALAELEAGVRGLHALQQQNRALLAKRLAQSEAHLRETSCGADVSSRAFPTQARNVIINSEI